MAADTFATAGTESVPGSPPDPLKKKAGMLASLIGVVTRRFPSLATLSRQLVYRTPGIQSVLFPRYAYWVDPGHLAAMVQLIDETRGRGAVIEIGVGRGDSSVFLLEHLRTRKDPRPLVLVDTFDGFTDESLEFEVTDRKKVASDISDYSYVSAKVFNKSLARLGYSNYRIIQGDCTKVDWDSLGPIGAVFLDVDVYLPTLASLEALWPRLVPGGGIVLDDCPGRAAWCDGAYQAYQEFIAAHDLPFVRVGGSSALVRKPAESPVS